MNRCHIIIMLLRSYGFTELRLVVSSNSQILQTIFQQIFPAVRYVQHSQFFHTQKFKSGLLVFNKGYYKVRTLDQIMPNS